MNNYIAEYQKWLDSPALSEDEWKELNEISGNEMEIKERFYAPLDFGTAGLRGTMKIGLHNMNIHIIRQATQAFADVICAEGEEAMERGIVIAHDCRLNGVLFAREAASVMAANGIHVRFFDALRPTPELSFAIRYYHTAAGLNITASHNPKEYNGYKVYWDDGAQLPPKQAEEISKLMRSSDVFSCFKSLDFDNAVADGMIELLGSETDELFLNKVMDQAIDKEIVYSVADEFKIVYTPFHGCGYKLVPEALKRLGIKNLYCVDEQMVIDGEFPTVVSPNPENPEGFYLAVNLAKKVDSDLIIGTDPDSDRIAAMVRKDGEYHVITGNQLGELLADYIICARIRKGSMPLNPAVVSSIVSTSMTRVICESNGVHYEDTFTGFKYMAEKIGEWDAAGSYQYILAFEESCGYMAGDYVRDKDAVTASLIVAEMSAYYFSKGMTLLDALSDLYNKYGYFMEKTVSIVMPGVDGIEKMSAIMADFRSNPPESISDTDIIKIRDYLDGSVFVRGLGKVGNTAISGSNVLFFEMSDGCNLVIRPSGTEPKIKIYVLARGENKQICEHKLNDYLKFAEGIA